MPAQLALVPKPIPTGGVGGKRRQRGRRRYPALALAATRERARGRASGVTRWTLKIRIRRVTQDATPATGARLSKTSTVFSRRERPADAPR